MKWPFRSREVKTTPHVKEEVKVLVVKWLKDNSKDDDIWENDNGRDRGRKLNQNGKRLLDSLMSRNHIAQGESAEEVFYSKPFQQELLATFKSDENPGTGRHHN